MHINKYIYCSKLVSLLQANVNHSLQSTFYKQVQIKYDEFRDEQNLKADIALENGKICFPEYQQIINDQRWDIAWKIFDEVNQSLGKNETI